MQFKQHFSSSSGNLYEVTSSNGQRLLLEMGVAWPKIQKALKYNLSNIQGAFLTHSHLDHSKGIKELIRAGIDVYASVETFTTLSVYDVRRAKFIRDKDLIKRKDFQVFAFALNHDAPTLGFIVRAIEENEYLLFAPDTGFITQNFKKYKFNIIAIECSYDKDILQHRVDTNDINETLAKRLLTSHLEWRETMRYLEEFCDLSHLRVLHLLHLSKDNIDKQQVKADFKAKFFLWPVIL